ncbi:hypothetical protein [Providencia sp. PROV019]|uniref:hypothetical protein n=1 Tax=Providencia sp. PROV019 TaxID=2949754 RepID=UPI0023490917|nr:hypothetical protein [Providencia sp. PROV019]
MNIKHYFVMLSNSSTKMIKEYEKSNSTEIKKKLLKKHLLKVMNVYNARGWNIKEKDKNKIDKAINVLDNIIHNEFLKSNLNKNGIASSVEIKSHHLLDRISLHYDSSCRQLGRKDIDSIFFDGVDRNNLMSTNVNIDFSNSILSGAIIKYDGNKALVRADFSNANLNDVKIKLPIKLGVDYNFTGAKLNNTDIEIGIPSGNLSEVNLVSLFGEDGNYIDSSAFKSILTINDKNIKLRLLNELKKAYESNRKYFEKHRNVEAEFLKQYNYFKKMVN